MVAPTLHFDAVYALLPPALKAGVDDLLSRATRESAVKHTLDQLVRFSLGREANDDDPDSCEEWDARRQKAEKALLRLHPGGADKSKKRARDDDGGSGTSEIETEAKKPRMQVDLGEDGVNDSPVFTLHTVSVSSPVRKKAHITIYHNTIRFMHATSGVPEASISLSSLTHAFLIPTPGKSKPHWTVIILSDTNSNQIIFGLDAVPPSLSTTAHPAPPHNHPKGTECKPALTQLLSHLPPHVTLQEPSTSQFRSATGEPYLNAYLRAKDGHLLFFKDGILFGEKKPCMWIGLEEIENVRSLSATGRTFSLFVTRVSDDLKDDEEGEGEETEFSLIDGKNQDAVARWVKDNHHRFGVRQGARTVGKNRAEEEDELAGDDEDTPEKTVGEDSEDLDDSDFESDSESDDGSTSQSSDEDGEGDQAEPEEAHSEGDDDDEELSQSKHPLLRPGAMPKLSKAAIDAVVGIVEEDMLGGAGPIANGAVLMDEDEDTDQLED